jgi:hypothetical protein
MDKNREWEGENEMEEREGGRRAKNKKEKKKRGKEMKKIKEGQFRYFTTQSTK